MNSISVRGIDEDLAVLLKQEAANAKMSVNQFVLDTLKKRVGLKKELRFTKEYSDLDHLFGKWTQDEFDSIQQKL
ncbi:Toxin-antitoxin system, antitoxin component, ribbon-helix-helix domain protein [Desulfamplus magnetovallimortis]|uniref:Toxin-antitoxin system, antitoxin component, ribbon-helix-helix domain protein n=1 Tax=Desulfamplus magnetovallimortis TaxID=1246637 RepID=A0A1W1HL02_9BACT|nr:hypothetical protein [Desulfamplus magnetovallimortis]SLM33028.1 Toxin-antitoxin system, antitoxin component, ribbon-helix-helix domain protein [Desulfamplus magnetovallimortis]